MYASVTFCSHVDTRLWNCHRGSLVQNADLHYVVVAYEAKRSCSSVLGSDVFMR